MAEVYADPTINPPTRYRHWTGRLAIHPDADRLDTVWPYPTIHYEHDTAVLTIPGYIDSGWTHLGWAPRPRTRWGRFWRHWHHGRLMGYPRLSVLALCVRNDLSGRHWST